MVAIANLAVIVIWLCMYVCNSHHLYPRNKRLLSIIQNSLGIFRAQVMETGSWCRLFLRMLTEIGRIQFWMSKIYWDLPVINLETFALWTFRKQFLILCHVMLTNISYLVANVDIFRCHSQNLGAQIVVLTSSELIPDSFSYCNKVPWCNG